MKIALFTAKPNPDIPVYTGEKRPPHGIGFLYSISNSLNHEVEIYDRYCGDFRWDNNNFSGYDMFGVYICSFCTADAFHIINKAECDLIVTGGPHCSMYPETIPEKVDYVVQGEGEKVILDILEGEVNRRVIKTDRLSSDELDNIPRFPYEYFYMNKERYNWTFPFGNEKPIFTMNTSRGCPFNCSFCHVRDIWGRKYTYMSAEKVFSDIKYLVNNFNCKGIYFREDNFTMNKRRVMALCEMLIESGLDIVWACETRVDTVDRDMMEQMKKAGCVGFYVGVEHLTQRMLDVFNKMITVDRILEFFDSAHELGIKTAASFVTDHPEETQEDISEKKRLLKVIKPTIIWNNKFRSDF